VAKGDGL